MADRNLSPKYRKPVCNLVQQTSTNSWTITLAWTGPFTINIYISCGLTLKRLSLYSFSLVSRGSLRSFSPRRSRSKPLAPMILPLPILRPPISRKLSFSLLSIGLPDRREPTAAVTWQPPPKLLLCGLRTTSRSSSLTRSLGSAKST